uniref:Fucosyltransferase n=1 Tax=Fagus sylvatica TaxID=28930 RepID=A0A2N9J4Y1_FAGSY
MDISLKGFVNFITYTMKLLKILAASFVALPVIVTLILFLRNPPADRVGGVSEARALENAAHNRTALHAGSEDASSQPTDMPIDKLLGGLLAPGFDEVSCLSSGLDNRVLTLASAFLYALLTNRVLLVDQGKDMADLFCEPFPEKSWFLPVDFPLKKRFKIFNQKSPHSYGNMLKKNILNTSRESLPSYLYLHLAHDYDDHDKLFFCDQYQTLLNRVPWLIMKTDNYFVPSLFLMPSFEQELSTLFPQRDTVFHHVGQHKVLPEVDRKRPIVSSTPSGKQNLKAVLITSLSSGYFENVRNMYWEHTTVTGDLVGVYQPSQEKFQQTEKRLHNRKAWAEMYLLSLTDVLVTSAWSTSGYVAQGLGGLKPWILYKSENQTAPNPPCGQAMSMEPCFHAPPFYDCKAKKGIDTGALVPHVTHCEDMSWGLKLVDNQDEL